MISLCPACHAKIHRTRGSVLIWILLGCFFWHDSVRSLIDGIAKVDRRASIVAAAYPFADHSIVGGANRRFVLFPESTVIRNGSLHDETNLAGQNTLKYFWGRIWSRDHQSVSTPTWNDGTFTWNGKMPMFSALDRSFDRPIDSSNSSVIDRDQYFSRRNMSNIVQRNLDEIPSHGTLWLSHYEVRPISDLKLADSNVNTSLSSYNLSLERGDLLLSDNRRIRATGERRTQRSRRGGIAVQPHAESGHNGASISTRNSEEGSQVKKVEANRVTSAPSPASGSRVIGSGEIWYDLDWLRRWRSQSRNRSVLKGWSQAILP